MNIIRGGVLLRAAIVLRPVVRRQHFALSQTGLVKAALVATVFAGLSACSVVQSVQNYVGLGEDEPKKTSESTGELRATYLGSVASDDAEVSEIGRTVLRDGGRAGDAAAAMGLALAVMGLASMWAFVGPSF